MRSAAGVEVGPETELPASRPVSTRVGAGTILLIGTWIGLMTGLCDIGLFVINKKIILRDFYRLSWDFAWLVPSAVTLLVLLPAGLIALRAKLWGPLPLAVPVALLSFIGFLELSSRLLLKIGPSLILCAGLAVQSVRFTKPRGEEFLRLVRGTVGLPAAILFAIACATISGRMWSEYRQTSALPPAPAGAQNVLLIVWDTVRASNTSLYGYRRATTPNLERLARRGVRFDLAFAASSWTLPSHASMLTGKWPHELRVDWKVPMRDDVPTLAGYLASRGYDTAGFVANFDYCAGETGLARGFAHYEDFPLGLFDTFTRYVAIGRRFDVAKTASDIESFLEKHTGRWYDVLPRSKEHEKNADEINLAFLKWLGKRPANERPFFAFLNYNDAHTPYEVPEPSIPAFGRRPASASQRQTLRSFTGLDKFQLSVDDVRMATDVYDDSIFYMDKHLGALLDELGRRRVLDNTLVIVTSDHGEHLGDHGLFFHGGSLYRQLVQVPLVMAGNTRIPQGGKVAEAISLRELPATVIDLLDLGPDQPFKSQSVARYWQQRGGEGERDRVLADPLLMETTKPELFMNGGREPAAKGPMWAVVAGGMHYIRTAAGSEELYNVNSDVEEKVDLAARDASAWPVLSQLRNLLGLMLQKR